MNALARYSVVVAVATLAAAPAIPVAAQQVGVTSTTAGEPRGTPPAQNERILRVGVDIQANERVRTAANDRAHLVFNDGSALTVGVDSDIVIDRYVYDPATQTGDLAMTTTRGAFRFVGGAISKKSEVIINTPSAAIGIRGAIATVTVNQRGDVTATFFYGEQMRVGNPSGLSAATRYGSQIYVTGSGGNLGVAVGTPPPGSTAYTPGKFGTVPLPGGKPSPPVVLPPGALQGYNYVFEHQQAGGNIIGPGDKAALDGLLAGLNPQPLTYAGFDPALLTWLTYLQSVASQGVATSNANRPSGQPPSTGGSAMPPSQPRPVINSLPRQGDG